MDKHMVGGKCFITHFLVFLVFTPHCVSSGRYYDTVVSRP